MTPGRFFHPDQVVPLKLSTNIEFVRLRAAQTAAPLVSGAHDGSELTVFVPSETNEPQAAIAGYACAKRNSKITKVVNRAFMVEFSWIATQRTFESRWVSQILSPFVESQRTPILPGRCR
jgi:hypothetical protein